MIELAVLLALTAVVGWVRPRWSSLSVTLVPTALAFSWLLLNEDVPGDETTLIDIAWLTGMSLVVGAGFALVCALAIVARRSTGRRRPAAHH